MVMALTPLFAADDKTGCDNSDNDYIKSDYALCSTHPYNVGLNEIPDSSGRNVMREVIAMKSELITQQMYQNYHALESMLSRLEKQLEKAVLTAQYKAASGNSDSKSSNSNDEDERRSRGTKSTAISSANDCGAKTSHDEIISCLNSNIQIIRNEIGNGSLSNARKQLTDDLATAQMNGYIGGSEGAYAQKRLNYQNCELRSETTSTKDSAGVTQTINADPMNNCSNIKNANRKTMQSCLNEFSAALRVASEWQDCKKSINSRGGYRY